MSCRSISRWTGSSSTAFRRWGRRSNGCAAIRLSASKSTISQHRTAGCVVLGQFQELPETPEWLEERQKAWLRLQEHADWWTPGYSKTVVAGQERPMVPVFFRIRCDTLTGHRVGEVETALQPTVDPLSRFLGTSGAGANGGHIPIIVAAQAIDPVTAGASFQNNLLSGLQRVISGSKSRSGIQCRFGIRDRTRKDGRHVPAYTSLPGGGRRIPR